jgi:two-component system KDP operon response regulator KdpE
MALEASDYSVIEAGSARDGLMLSALNKPDVILLDLGLPDDDGLVVLKRLREWTTVPVIVLTVRDEERVKIEALDSGADDYITKPFNTGELLARIRVAIRHSYRLDESPVFRYADLEVDLNTRIVKLKGSEVKLTATEFSLLALFIRNAGKVLTHSFISRQIWSNPYSSNAQILRVHIAQLRKKIEGNPSLPVLLITEQGIGYRLKMD